MTHPTPKHPSAAKDTFTHDIPCKMSGPMGLDAPGPRMFEIWAEISDGDIVVTCEKPQEKFVIRREPSPEGKGITLETFKQEKPNAI